MKQLAVEFFRREIIVNSITKEDRNGRFYFKIGLSKLDELSSKANELEKQQLDNYAIEFAEWITQQPQGKIIKKSGIDNSYMKMNSKELLEIFKKEKGL